MKKTNPKISIIIPIYNVEKYLSKCIDSILIQTYRDFELLLIDDGSKDKSGEICDTYAKMDNRVKVFHKDNGGVSSARNYGICKAVGDWISFVDSDDWVEKECYSTLMDDDKVADLTYFGCCCCYIDGSRTVFSPCDFFSTNKNNIEKHLALLKDNNQKFEYLGYTWNKLFKKELIDKYNIRFVEDLAMREDELFTLSYARYIDSLRVKSSVLYNYRVIPTGLTHSIKRSKSYLFLSKKLLDILPFYSDSKLLLLEKKSILFYYFMAIIQERIWSKEWLNSIKTFVSFGHNLNFDYKDISVKYVIIFYFKCKLWQYFATILLTILSKRRMNNDMF